MEDTEFVDRGRAVLVPKERRHLMGLLDETPTEDEDANAIRRREYRIRQRFRESVIDFVLLAQRFSVLEQVFQPLHEAYESQQDSPLRSESSTPVDEDFVDGLSGLFSVLFRGLATVSPDGSTVNTALFETHLNRGVSHALEQMYVEQGYSVLPGSVSYHAEETSAPGHVVPIETVKEAYERGEPLREEEMAHLYWAGEVSRSEYQSYDPLDLLHGGEPVEEPIDRDAIEKLLNGDNDNDGIEDRRARDSIDDTGESDPRSSSSGRQ